MLRYKISYLDGSSEEVQAGRYYSEGDWIVFSDGSGEKARIRAAVVDRVDRVDS